MGSIRWEYNYSSVVGKQNKHWHRFCGQNSAEVSRNGFGWLLPIWEAAKLKLRLADVYGVYNFNRMYVSAHTFGIEPHRHTDDGDYTMIYYPNTEWKKEWGGGTMIKNEVCDYVGNRLVIFPASEKHQAMPVSRDCYELRSVVVFKTCTRITENPA
tara:strand:- start:1659 stop:2126 length:468 start_codon:yes stop_codon:yes gene_type:complete